MSQMTTQGVTNLPQQPRRVLSSKKSTSSSLVMTVAIIAIIVFIFMMPGPRRKEKVETYSMSATPAAVEQQATILQKQIGIMEQELAKMNLQLQSLRGLVVYSEQEKGEK